MASGRFNIAFGFLSIAGFVILGFVLVYLRDFAPGKEDWVADYAVGKHFETRLAHAHGNLFALINVALGFTIPRLTLGDGAKSALAWLGIGGMLMPLGILGEVVVGTPPAFVLIGGAAMFIAVTFAGLAGLREPRASVMA